MLRTEPLEFGETSLQGFEVKLASECEMIDLVLQLELLEFKKSIDRCKKNGYFGS